MTNNYHDSRATMVPLSDKERAHRYRYATQLERTADKLLRLVLNPPEGMSPNSPEHMTTHAVVMDCLVALMGADGNEWYEDQDRRGMLFYYERSEDDPPSWSELPDDALLQLNPDLVEYIDWKEKNKPSRTALKLSKIKFCREILTAEMANPRWSWVGIRKTDEQNEGSIFIFSWSHLLNNLDPENPVIDLFSNEVLLTNSGRKSPGHRDALEKLHFGIENKYTFYIVWQNAVDESAEVLKGTSINGEFLTIFEPNLNEDNIWQAKLSGHCEINW